MGSGRNSNSSELLSMSFLPARMKMIQSKMKGLEWSQRCSYFKSMFFFSDTQGQLTLQSMIGFWPNFELSRTLMVFLITCKNQEDPNKTEGARVLRTFSPLLVYGDFSKGSLLRSPRSDLADFQNSSEMLCARVLTVFSSL